MTERRKTKRYQVSYPIECKNGPAHHTITLIDVSKGGVAFTVPDEVQENQKIDIKIFLKNRMFNVKAVVVHVKHLGEGLYNIGARFFNIPEKFHQTLTTEIDEIAQYRRECNLYHHKSLTFEKASTEYLKKTPPSKT